MNPIALNLSANPLCCDMMSTRKVPQTPFYCLGKSDGLTGKKIKKIADTIHEMSGSHVHAKFVENKCGKVIKTMRRMPDKKRKAGRLFSMPLGGAVGAIPPTSFQGYCVLIIVQTPNLPRLICISCRQNSNRTPLSRGLALLHPVIQAVVGSIPGRAAIKLPRSTQPSILVG